MQAFLHVKRGAAELLEGDAKRTAIVPELPIVARHCDAPESIAPASDSTHPLMLVPSELLFAVMRWLPERDACSLARVNTAFWAVFHMHYQRKQIRLHATAPFLTRLPVVEDFYRRHGKIRVERVTLCYDVIDRLPVEVFNALTVRLLALVVNYTELHTSTASNGFQCGVSGFDPSYRYPMLGDFDTGNWLRWQNDDSVLGKQEPTVISTCTIAKRQKTIWFTVNGPPPPTATSGNDDDDVSRSYKMVLRAHFRYSALVKPYTPALTMYVMNDTAHLRLLGGAGMLLNCVSTLHLCDDGDLPQADGCVASSHRVLLFRLEKLAFDFRFITVYIPLMCRTINKHDELVRLSPGEISRICTTYSVVPCIPQNLLLALYSRTVTLYDAGVLLVYASVCQLAVRGDFPSFDVRIPTQAEYAEILQLALDVLAPSMPLYAIKFESALRVSEQYWRSVAEQRL